MTASSNVVDAVEQNYAVLLALGRSLAGSDGADVVQDTMLAALRSRASVESPLRWLKRAVRNRAVSHHRSTQRRLARDTATGADQNDPLSPESALARTELWDALHEEWSKLPALFAEALRLRFEEGLTSREIGQRQRCPANTASWRVREGMSRLRKQLDRRFGDRQNWLSALVAVPGIVGPPRPAAETNTTTMKVLSITLATLTVGAAGYAVHERSGPRKNVDSKREGAVAPTTAAMRKGSRVLEDAPTTVATEPSGEATNDAASLPAASGSVNAPDLRYGVQLSNVAVLWGCGEETGELASNARDVFLPCAEAHGYAAQEKFFFQVEFESGDDGMSKISKLRFNPETYPGGTPVVRCMVDELFSEPYRGVEGTIGIELRRLEGEDEPEAEAARAFQKAPVELPVDGVAWRGAEDAPITILECIDPDCPFTRAAAPTLDRLLDDFDGVVRVGQLQRPIPGHPEAPRKSRALLVARSHGKYWEASDYLHMHPEESGDDLLRALAKEIGVEPQSFIANVDAPGTVAMLESESESCADAGSVGTPTFFFEGHRIAGARSFEAFAGLIGLIQDSRR